MLECEEHDDRQLSSHEELPEVRGGSLVSFAGCAEYNDVRKHRPEGGKGHGDGYPGGGLLQAHTADYFTLQSRCCQLGA